MISERKGVDFWSHYHTFVLSEDVPGNGESDPGYVLDTEFFNIETLVGFQKFQEHYYTCGVG